MWWLSTFSHNSGYNVSPGSSFQLPVLSSHFLPRRKSIS
jgi:hypothetical protein